ncbi:MAG: DUF6268 family outer membrane beta-barrel protein [Planctomycetota bacterium]
MNNHRSLVALGASLLLGACATTARLEPRAGPSPEPKQDYSPQGLFGEAHGDFVAVMDRYRPQVQGSFMLEPGSRLDDEPGDFDMWRLLADGRVPLVIDPDSVLLVGGRTEAKRFDFKSDMRGLQDETVGSIGLEIGYGRFINEDTYAYATFQPGVYSDFDGTLTSEDWEFFGESLVTFRYNDNVFYKGGVRVSKDFPDLPIFPLVGASWLLDDQWRVDVLLPKRAEISYQPQPATTVYGGLELEGQEYRVRAPNGNRSDWNQQELRLYIGAIQRFDDHLSAFARFGSAIAGKHIFRNPAGVRVDGQLEPVVLFEVGVGWDF